MILDHSRGWKDLHNDAIVADLHAHPPLKVALFHRNLARGYSTIFRSAFNPFSVRTAFPNLEIGGIDVLFSAIYAPEKGLLDDISLLRTLRLLRPQTWKEVIKPPYFEVATNMIEAIEKLVRSYNKRRTNKTKPIKIARSKDELDHIIGDSQDRSIALVHCIEGAHSLQGRICGKEFGEVEGIDQNQMKEEILDNLVELANKGVAYITLAHFYPNRIAAPCFPFPEKMLSFTRRAHVLRSFDLSLGLTSIGESVVEKNARNEDDN